MGGTIYIYKAYIAAGRYRLSGSQTCTLTRDRDVFRVWLGDELVLEKLTCSVFVVWSLGNILASVDTADGGNLAPSDVLNFQNLRRLRWCRSSSINSGVSLS